MSWTVPAKPVRAVTWGRDPPCFSQTAPSGWVAHFGTGRTVAAVTPLTLLLPLVAATRAASTHLRDQGPATGCGCPAWLPGLDPDAAAVPHTALCPLVAVDEVFNTAAPVMAELTGAAGLGSWAQAHAHVAALPRSVQAGGTVALALALTGATRLRVHADAAQALRTEDLADAAVERFAVIDQLTSSDDIPLGVETMVRLLLASDMNRQLDRMLALLSGDASVDLDDLDVADLLMNVFVALNQVLSDVAGADTLPEGLSLSTLASEGFNLMAGIRGALDVCDQPEPDRAVVVPTLPTHCAACGATVGHWNNWGAANAYPVCSHDTEHDAAGRWAGERAGA